MNILVLKGNLGSDPIIRTSATERTYAFLSIAVNQRVGRGKDPVTEWYRIVAFDKLAETLVNIHRGDEVLVTGSLRRTTYTTDGVEHRDVEVRAQAIEFLRRSRRNEVEPLQEAAESDWPHAADSTFGVLEDLEGDAATSIAESRPRSGARSRGRRALK